MSESFFFYTFYKEIIVEFNDTLLQIISFLENLNYNFEVKIQDQKDTISILSNLHELTSFLEDKNSLDFKSILINISANDDFDCTVHFNTSSFYDSKMPRWTLSCPDEYFNVRFFSEEKVENNFNIYIKLMSLLFELIPSPDFCVMIIPEMFEDFLLPDVPNNYSQPLPQVYPINYYSFTYMERAGINPSAILQSDFDIIREFENGIFFVPKYSYYGFLETYFGNELYVEEIKKLLL